MEKTQILVDSTFAEYQNVVFGRSKQMSGEDEGMNSVEKLKRKIMTKLVNVIASLPQYQAEKFDSVQIFPELLSWLKYFLESDKKHFLKIRSTRNGI